MIGWITHISICDTYLDSIGPTSTEIGNSRLIFVDIMRIRIIRDFSDVGRSNIRISERRIIVQISKRNTCLVSLIPASTVSRGGPQIFVDIMPIRIINDQFLMSDEATIFPEPVWWSSRSRYTIPARLESSQFPPTSPIDIISSSTPCQSV